MRAKQRKICSVQLVDYTEKMFSTLIAKNYISPESVFL
jgi:hypothetical protein